MAAYDVDFGGKSPIAGGARGGVISAAGMKTEYVTLGAGAAGAQAASFSAPGLTDPVAASQWHLAKLGGIGKVWEDYTGKGVHVGVYDSGIQYSHWDLNDNSDTSLHVTINGKTYGGSYRVASGPHGTSVAGIIAAERNGEGGVGIAYDAKLTGVNIFDPYSGGKLDPGIYVNADDPTLFFEAVRASSRFDVVNHSWGGSSNFLTAASRTTEGTFANRMAEATAYAAEVGRGGLGTISVDAAGNDSGDSQGDSWKSDRHVITVGAYREVDGNSSYYSSRGAHLLVSAPSDDYAELGGTGVVTTDLLGDSGYNTTDDPGGDQDYTNAFGGTSAATPVVSGVVSLILDANEGLGWRDVKNILAASAHAPIDVTSGPTSYTTEFGEVPLNESRFQLAGKDADWNGGAMHYSTDYGYGAVNAYAAVRMAEVWSLFGKAQTSANEVSYATPEITVGLTSVGGSDDLTYTGQTAHQDFFREPVSFQFKVDGDVDLEHVDLTINFTVGNGRITTSMFGEKLKLIAPDGSFAFVDTNDAQGGRTQAASESFTFGFAGLRGVDTKGTWTLQFEEPYDAPNFFKVNTLQATFYGAQVTTSDVHTYTDEFFTMAAIAGEGGRRVLSDTDGGVDWINAAAVTKNVELSLVQGAKTRFGGVDAFTVALGSVIENAVTGDGDDRLFGNAGDNRLYGMRGADWLNGGAGNDTLFGGTGRDVFAFDTAGVSGNDHILDWSAGDRIATSKQLRGADQNGLVTIGSSALVLLDNSAKGDSAELVGQGGAVLQALGKSDGYWWYGFVSQGSRDHVDGRVIELALGQAGRPVEYGSAAAASAAAHDAADTGFAAHHAAFYLYDTMGDAMASGVQTHA